MKIIALGSCCKKAKLNYQNAIVAAKNCGITEEVENIGEYTEIMKFGVMSTPALVIDGKVVASGKVLKINQIEELINQRK